MVSLSVRFTPFSTMHSGYASLNRDGKLLLISNLKDGIDEYQFPSMEIVQTFTHPIDTNFILRTRLLLSRNLIVAGSDNGFTCVFNRISGQLVSKIPHGSMSQCKVDSAVLLTCPSLWPACTSCRGRALSHQISSYLLTFSECRLLSTVTPVVPVL